MTLLYCNACGGVIPPVRIKGYGPKWPRVCSDNCKNAYRQLKRDAKNLGTQRAKDGASARERAKARVQERDQSAVATPQSLCVDGHKSSGP